MSGETSILEMVTFRNGTLTKKCSLRRFNIIVATQQRILTLPLKTIKPMGFICPRGSTQHKGEFIPCERLGAIQNQSCNKPISECYVIQFYTFFFLVRVYLTDLPHYIYSLACYILSDLICFWKKIKIGTALSTHPISVIEF